MENLIQLRADSIKFIAVCNDCRKTVGPWRNTKSEAESDGDAHTNKPDNSYHIIKIAIQDIR